MTHKILLLNLATILLSILSSSSPFIPHPPFATLVSLLLIPQTHLGYSCQNLWPCIPSAWDVVAPRYLHGFLLHFLRVFVQMSSLSEAFPDWSILRYNPPSPLSLFLSLSCFSPSLSHSLIIYMCVFFSGLRIEPRTSSCTCWVSSLPLSYRTSAPYVVMVCLAPLACKPKDSRNSRQ
jgi:hypothetical protein